MFEIEMSDWLSLEMDDVNADVRLIAPDLQAIGFPLKLMFSILTIPV